MADIRISEKMNERAAQVLSQRPWATAVLNRISEKAGEGSFFLRLTCKEIYELTGGIEEYDFVQFMRYHGFSVEAQKDGCDHLEAIAVLW